MFWVKWMRFLRAESQSMRVACFNDLGRLLWRLQFQAFQAIAVRVVALEILEGFLRRCLRSGGVIRTAWKSRSRLFQQVRVLRHRHRPCFLQTIDCAALAHDFLG